MGAYACAATAALLAGSGGRDPRLAALALAIAVFAAYSGLLLAGRCAMAAGWLRCGWMGASALTFGMGAWAANFTALLAADGGAAARYRWPLAALALLVAVIGSGGALLIGRRGAAGARGRLWVGPSGKRGFWVAGGLALGLTIAAASALALAAGGVPLAGWRLAAAAALAAAAGLIALRLTLARWRADGFEQRRPGAVRPALRTLAGALVLGGAIGASHALVGGDPGGRLPADGGWLIDAAGLSDAIGGATLLLASIALIAALVDRRLAVQTDQWMALFNQLPDAVYALDRGGSIRGSNPASGRLTGYAAGQVPGAALGSLLAPNGGPSLADHVAAAGRGEALHYEGTIATIDGRRIPVSVTQAPITVAGAIDGSYCIVHDASERKAAEAAIRQQRDRSDLLLGGISALGKAVLVDDGGHILYVNDAASVLTGYSEAELLALPSPVALLAAGSPEADDLRRRFAAVGDLVHSDGVARHKRGHAVPIELACTVMRGALGWQRITVMHDISRRKAVERDLQETNILQRALLDNASVAVISVSPRGIIRSFNKTAERWLGYRAGELVGKTNPVLLHDRDELRARAAELSAELGRPVASNFEVLVAAVRPDQPDEHEWTYVRSDGSRFPVLFSVTALCDDQGRVTGFMGVASDMTARKQAAAAQERAYQLALANVGLQSEVAAQTRAAEEIGRLNERLDQRASLLEAANRELEAFSYSVSHDLRAPLRSLSGFSAALLEDYAEQIDETGKDYLRRIQAAAGRMDGLIDDLLQLSQVARVAMRRDRVDLSGLAWQVADELGQSQPERAVEWRIAPGLNCEGDPALLGIVLTNLLGNAWKFTGKTAAPLIEFGAAGPVGAPAACQGTADGQVFFVRDNGCGFDMAYASKLFGAFQRLHGAQEFGGSGIGLATVQRIIHRHGGRIWAEGAVGRGATFFFCL